MRRTLHIGLLLLLVMASFIGANAQPRRVIYLQKYNSEPYHFGFLLGVNFMDYTLKTKESYQDSIHQKVFFPTNIGNVSEHEFDKFQILSAESRTTPGFSVGVIGDLRLGRYFNLRFSPTLSLSSKYVTYVTRLYRSDNSVYDSCRVVVSDDKLATFLEFPLHIKYRSKRYNNIGAYLIAGINPKLYLASLKNKTNSDGTPALLQTNRADVAFEFGAGYDIYNQWFKMGIEIKMSFGLLNMLKTNNVTEHFLYNVPFKSLRNNQLQLSFTFE